MIDNKKNMLAWFAKLWIGTTENGGSNKGQIVEMFQKAVDGKAQGEPWCMSFVQFCLKAVDAGMNEIAQATYPEHRVYKTEHCMTAYAQTPIVCRGQLPEVGSIVIWCLLDANKKQTTSGHCGIVVQVDANGDIHTVEGNTSTGKGDQREGEGCYLRLRKNGDVPGFVRIGYLKPWENA